MAWTIQLEAGTDTLNLHDGSVTFVNPGGFHAPPPGERRSMAGGGFAAHGGDMVAQAYENRQVTVGFQIKGTSGSAVAAKVQDAWAMLRKAREWAVDGLGTQVQLRYQWEGADAPVFFNVLSGQLDLGRDLHGPALVVGTRVRNAEMRLLCEPFAVGTAETAENYLRDPSFEVAGTALADWVKVDSTGTTTRVTGTAKYGTASAKIVRTGGTAENAIYQDRVQFTGGNIVSASVWTNPESLVAGMAAELKVESFSTGGTSQAVVGTAQGTATGTYVQLTLANLTLPAGHGTVRAVLRLTGGTGTGTAHFDGVYFGSGSALPTAWASGREVRNHFDDEGQLHVNYLDVYGVPGDVPAALQVKATENEAHTDFWMGARHAGRLGNTGIWHEGEAFSGSSTLATAADFSKGSAAQIQLQHSWQQRMNATGTDVSTLTGTMVVSTAGTSRLLMLGLGIESTTTATLTPSTVTFEGTAMTLLGTALGSAGSTANVWAGIYHLANPPTATGTLQVGWGTAQHAAGLMLIMYYDSTAVFGATSTFASGTAGSGSAACTGTTNDLVFGVIISAGITVGIATASNQHFVAGSIGTRAVLYVNDYYNIGTGTTVSASGMASTALAIVAAAVKPRYSLAAPRILTTAVASPPAGIYRALARVRGDGRKYGFAMGYGYGAVTADPTEASDYSTIGSGTTEWQIKDLGMLSVPPIETPSGQSTGTLTLRLANYVASGNTIGTCLIDYLFLLPLDQGMVYANKASTADVVMADSRSPLKAVYLLDGSNVVRSMPANQVGSPPEAHPQGSRYYLLCDDGTANIADGWLVSISYLPKFMHVE